MRFSADDYREAAEERAEDARTLYGAGRYASAHYTAGLAVECLLRAYRRRSDPDFDSRHDVAQLIIVSGFAENLQDIDRKERESLTAAFNVVINGWRNNQRYCSAHSLRRFLKQERLDRGVRGDYLKENSRRMCVAADIIVQEGQRLWSK